jgi:hypothetical protein
MEMAKAVSRYRFAAAVQKWWAAERWVALQSALYGVRWQNAVATALWPWRRVGVVLRVWNWAKAVSRYRSATAVQKWWAAER